MARAIEHFVIPLWLAALVGTLAGCGYGEHASVIIKYDARLPSDSWSLPSSGQHGVQDAFKQFTKRNDYTCRANFKHTDETICRGPKDLHLSFQPALNKSEFIAEFSWMNTSDRTHDEFVRLVSGFATHMTTLVGKENVRFDVEP